MIDSLQYNYILCLSTTISIKLEIKIIRDSYVWCLFYEKSKKINKIFYISWIKYLKKKWLHTPYNIFCTFILYLDGSFTYSIITSLGRTF